MACLFLLVPLWDDFQKLYVFEPRGLDADLGFQVTSTESYWYNWYNFRKGLTKI